MLWGPGPAPPQGPHLGSCGDALTVGVEGLPFHPQLLDSSCSRAAWPCAVLHWELWWGKVVEKETLAGHPLGRGAVGAELSLPEAGGLLPPSCSQ